MHFVAYAVWSAKSSIVFALLLHVVNFLPLLASPTPLSAGDEVVIEEFLMGEEASLFAFVDGEHVYPL